MSDFCTNCTPFTGEADIDLFLLALNLQPGYSRTFICEGCSNRGVYKDVTGRLYLAKQLDRDITLHSVAIEELMLLDPEV